MWQPSRFYALSMDAIAHALAQHGLSLVGLNVLLQQLGMPIPAVPTMMLAGAMATAGRLNLPAAFAIAVVASLLADLVWYWAGRRFGYPVLRLLCRVSLSPDTCVRQTEGIFERWGFYSVVVSKFVPGFSTVAPPIAGALRMRVGVFALASAASGALWAGAAMLAGVLFARQIDLLIAWMTSHAIIAGVVVALLVALYAFVKGWQRWRMTRLLATATISIAELRDALDLDPPPFLIDVGSALAHGARPHIPGAVLLDLDTIARESDFPRDRDIVVYCACPNEVSARKAAQILMQKGFRRVRPLAGGIDAWTKAGLPLAEGVPVRVAPRRPTLEAV
jgi:membrane protein DedA with SNARE-associated domain/rhodanese-related sulfurtransferase